MRGAWGVERGALSVERETRTEWLGAFAISQSCSCSPALSLPPFDVAQDGPFKFLGAALSMPKGRRVIVTQEDLDERR